MRTILMSCLFAFVSPAVALASSCYAFVDGPRATRLASLDLAYVAPEVAILYVAHSTYRIESPGGVVANTDYFGANGPGGLPDIVTMNHAHETHWTAFPDPAIPHVLRGWNPDGDGPAEHKITVADVTVRNVTTDIRGWGDTGKDGNSIFVFEVADLCIGHLGHLHHPLTEQHYARLGRLDVLMVPVDGTYTMNTADMIEVAKRLKSSIILPMHAFGPSSLERFLLGMSDEFVIRQAESPVLRVSVDSLPVEPTVMVMPSAQYRSREDLGLD